MVSANMHGTIGIPVRNILKHFHPNKGRLGMLITSTPKQQGENNAKEGPMKNDEAEPIVAFNKPPLPPFLGPFVALSLLEMGSGRDGSED